VNERNAMARALALALRGWGRTRPNPLVGCVIVKRGVRVAEGWHAEVGEVHAERMALVAAGEGARGGTLVCTLEPCVHVGRQPPCVEAILAAGIVRVHAALADPNPVAGGGAAQLRAAGLIVEMGEYAHLAADQNGPFLHQFRNAERPWIALKLAQSLDGRIADAHGRARWISSAEAQAWVQHQRAGYDAIVVGGRTARLDDPRLTVRGTVVPRVPPTRVVITSSADVPLDGQLVQSARDVPVVVTARPDAPLARLQALEAAGVQVVLADDLAAALGALRRAGLGALFVEGGGRLAGALVQAEAVDRLCLVQSPIMIGEGGAPAFAGVPDAAVATAPRWRVLERRNLGDDTLQILART